VGPVGAVRGPARRPRPSGRRRRCSGDHLAHAYCQAPNDSASFAPLTNSPGRGPPAIA
jgi:hypothetical protein